MKIDIQKLYDYVDKNFLIKRYHPNLDLIIWNYSVTTQYEKKWDDITLQCRGLVTDSKGNIVSPCIPKFFNWEELENIPNEPYSIYKKYDGSYISLFYYNEQWVFASRGGFTSPQAELAFEIFNKKYKNQVQLNPQINYIFEVIGKSNQIILNYEEDNLILLTSFNVADNKEIDIYNSNEYDGFKLAEKFNLKGNYKLIKDQIPDDEEGYVLKFESGFRMKLKGVKYFTLHAMLSEISTISIWKNLKDDNDISQILLKLPDETYDWVLNVYERLVNNYNTTFEYHFQIYDQYKHLETKKEFANQILSLNNEKINPQILFKMWDGKDYDNLVWKMVKPERILPNNNINF